jgi:2,4-dienoyl-CoA reductase-like NADH-dependent reductase (Old Yellow Enzyme family)/thioredoxin reductase
MADMKLLEPMEIKGMRLKNRIGLAPLANYPRNPDGSVNDLTIRWYEERAKGETGFIMHGPARISPALIPSFTKLTKVIQSYGSVIGVQVVGGGPMGGQGPSPSPFPDANAAKLGIFEYLTGEIIPVRELSIEEIEQIEDDLAVAAANSKAAGFDCVELHCTHGAASLASAFVSPFYNRRTDKYGGDWEGRLRFPANVIRKMREAVGDDYPLLVRISADNLLGKRGVTIEDTLKHVVPALEEAGVDCFDVSQGSMTHSTQGIILPMYYPRGCYIHLAEAVKQVTELPVIGVGRIVDMEMAERFLQEGKADIIYMGRQLTADPETPKKYFEGRPEDIRKCIGCVIQVVQEGGMGICGRPCAINYDIQDNPIPLTPAEKAKTILVIGGGVGGMEAARIATLRGHKVILMEKEPELGGMVAALALTPMTAEFRNIVDDLGTQMRKLGVDVRVCKEAAVVDMEELKPDVVIVAAGSSMLVPEIARGKPGVMDHIEAAKNWRAIGQKVVIWGLVAAELAISLAEEGKDVVMIGRGGEETLARDAPWARRMYLFRRLTDVNLVRESPEAMRMDNPEILYYVDVEDITPEGIRIVNKDGKRRVLPYDTLIVSREREANDSLFEHLKGKAPEVYKIGDCSEVGDIKTAIWSANEVARKI